MKTPQEKYQNDPKYRMLVDTMENLIHQAEFTPSEVREAAMFACIKYEYCRPPRPMFIPKRCLGPEFEYRFQEDFPFKIKYPEGVSRGEDREFDD
jgi:hypothetical protein